MPESIYKHSFPSACFVLVVEQKKKKKKHNCPTHPLMSQIDVVAMHMARDNELARERQIQSEVERYMAVINSKHRYV